MALTLPLVVGLNPEYHAALFRSLDQPVLAALLTELCRACDWYCGKEAGRREPHLCKDGVGCRVALFGVGVPATFSVSVHKCSDCERHFDLAWRKAAERVERGLLEAGWGYA